MDEDDEQILPVSDPPAVPARRAIAAVAVVANVVAILYFGIRNTDLSPPNFSSAIKIDADLLALSPFPSQTPTTSSPSVYPSEEPSSDPSMSPSFLPSVPPSMSPSAIPSGLPSLFPSQSPSNPPSTLPSTSPSDHPSSTPSAHPSNQPSTSPSAHPSTSPSAHPSALPSTSPSVSPSGSPSSKPSGLPSSAPSEQPSSLPSSSPSASPSGSPSSSPTATPSVSPTSKPTNRPTKEPTRAPVVRPTFRPTRPRTDEGGEDVELLYRPGDLTNFEEGLLLSRGLSARIIAKAGDRVSYVNGRRSGESFHERPDGAATFPDTRSHNPGGWVYVSNSEVKDGGDGRGGVGAVTFNRYGEIIDYKMILKGTTNNCSGGRTPWNTWVSCEEINKGKVYQVDPFGVRQSEMLTLGNTGGHWESFAYDIRNPDKPYFFVTEDEPKGCLRRFTPDPRYIDWVNDPWNMLHSPGTTDYLKLEPDRTGESGTFSWTTNLRSAENNAKAHYPETEGIDVYGNEIFFVIKRRKELFVLNTVDGTYWKQSTVSGVFDGMPDQMQRIIGNDEDLLYFTEERGRDNGIHASDASGRFYTIFESPVYSDETTGLAFSPDGMHMYVAYQNRGYLFDIFRRDGLPFQAKKLDVKYHATDR